jgi:hypothetical protein
MSLKNKSIWMRWVFPILGVYFAIIVVGTILSLVVGSNLVEHAKLFGFPILAVLIISGLITSKRTWAKLIGAGLIVSNLASLLTLEGSVSVIAGIATAVVLPIGYGMAKLWRRVVGNYEPLPVTAADAADLKRKFTGQD